MSAIIKIGSETEVTDVPSARVGEPRVSRSVTAGMTDAEFEAWLVAQGAVPMSDERRAALQLSLSGVEGCSLDVRCGCGAEVVRLKSLPRG